MDFVQSSCNNKTAKLKALEIQRIKRWFTFGKSRGIG